MCVWLHSGLTGSAIGFLIIPLVVVIATALMKGHEKVDIIPHQHHALLDCN